jgi:hypothetical protein
MINAGVSLELGSATMEGQMLNPASLGTIRYTFATFPLGQFSTALSLFSVTVPPQQRYCRRQTGDTTLSFPGRDSAALNFVLEGTIDGCASGKNE